MIPDTCRAHLKIIALYTFAVLPGRAACRYFEIKFGEEHFPISRIPHMLNKIRDTQHKPQLQVQSLLSLETCASSSTMRAESLAFSPVNSRTWRSAISALLSAAVALASATGSESKRTFLQAPSS